MRQTLTPEGREMYAVPITDKNPHICRISATRLRVTLVPPLVINSTRGAVKGSGTSIGTG